MKWAYKSYWDKIPGIKAENHNPAFPEFVEFIVAKPYAFVAKLETASRDSPTFLSLAGDDSSDSSLAQDNARHTVRGVVTMDSKAYFAQLSFDQVMSIFTTLNCSATTSETMFFTF
ncbi:hypothetical protein HPB48_020706 [Haemaphysalis longicornis]|uniref:Uncharacterized protein n=1 Tax=Haemaphysalis longicornis TaxID=44386 RepID=A0A9J6G848_HAELO|nr:hypothetical protein HPB48_020706 [Haemaphysalis longicornis]